MGREVEVYSQTCERCGVEFEVPAAHVDRTGRLSCTGCGAVYESQWLASRDASGRTVTTTTGSAAWV